jgi:hypothetical protein
VPTSVSPEEADRIATEYFAQQGFPEAYRVARVAELPELNKFYYLAPRNLAREWTDLNDDDMPIGSGGFFVSLSTGEVEGIGSGPFVFAYGYLRARDQLTPDVAPSVQELAALLARHSWDQLIAMCQELPRKQEGDTPGRIKAAWAWIRRAARGR